MTAEGVAYLAAGFSIGIAALGTALGIGHLGAKGLEAMARQPEEKAAIQRSMIIVCAFIEALCLYAFVIALMLVAKKAENAPAHDVSPKSAIEQPAHTP